MTAGRVARRAAITLGALLVAGVLSASGWAGYVRASGNVHSVIAGQLYRSAELSKLGFEQVIARDHIRTVINLRGANPGRTWYRHEVAAAKAMGVSHVDIAMSASHVPSARTLAEIYRTLARAARPILIHCQGGADRSGLVAALYELWIAKLPPSSAGKQLSFYYGHFPWLGSPTAAMDQAWREVVRRYETGSRTMGADKTRVLRHLSRIRPGPLPYSAALRSAAAAGMVRENSVVRSRSSANQAEIAASRGPI